MTVSYQIEGEVFILRLEGEFEADELSSAGERAARDPQFTAPMLLLVDSRRSETTLSTESIRNSLNRLSRKGQFRERVAHVASDELHRALGRMAESYAELEGLQFKTFNEIEQARAWLTASVDEDS
ncbi:MAG: hypothetical protein O7G84_19325 [Gammaproteobacteria bacterium]|nr:hypothetical protein [Gammaproteobacteria bacterium]